MRGKRVVGSAERGNRGSKLGKRRGGKNTWIPKNLVQSSQKAFINIFLLMCGGGSDSTIFSIINSNKEIKKNN